MIAKDSKVALTPKLDSAVETLELPPPYTGPSSSAGPVLLRAAAPSEAQCCNFLHIKRQNHSVKGSFVVDPDLMIPAELLPPAIGEEGEHKNLRLESKNGSVNADVWVVGWDSGDVAGDGGSRAEPVLMEMNSNNGSVTVKLHANCATRPIKIKATSHNSSVHVMIPPSFNGFLTLGSKNGSIKLSDPVRKKHLTAISDNKGSQKYFLGDLTAEKCAAGKEEWTGSSLEAYSHNGNVRVSFVDEVSTSSHGMCPISFFSHFFKHLGSSS